MTCDLIDVTLLNEPSYFGWVVNYEKRIFFNYVQVKIIIKEAGEIKICSCDYCDVTCYRSTVIF